MGEKVNTKVIYTAIFGNELGLIPQPKLAGFDYICFTDQLHLKAKPWKVIHVETPFPEDLTRSNRYLKILAHKFVKNYETSVYIDANFLIVGDLNQLMQACLSAYSMVVFNHAFTVPDNRDCIYEEAQAINALREKGIYNKENSAAVERHINFLRSENYPENYGLIKGGFLLRKHNAEDVIKVMEDWWFMIENYSKRDQMSFNYVAWKNNFEFKFIDQDIRRGNPYIYWLGNHRKSWTLKLLKFKIKKKLGWIKIPET